MDNKKKVPELRMLILISNEKLVEKAAVLFQKGNIPIQYQFCAQGTAPSEMLEMLGLGNTEKVILLSMMPREFAFIMLKKLKKELKLGTTDSGIALTVPMTGGNSRLISILEQVNAVNGGALPNMKKEGTYMAEYNYSIILAVVNQGYSQEVMTAARKAGAAGGTTFNMRRLVNDETVKFWGLSVNQEKEMVSIVATAEDKVQIMKAISDACGMHSEARGVVLSLPVEEVIGLD